MVPTIGQIFKGRHASYRIIQALKKDKVFKAISFPHHLPSAANVNLAVLKFEPSDKTKCMYRREYQNYQQPLIRQSPYFRAFLDDVGYDSSSTDDASPPEPRAMVFEWMDADLRSLRPGSALAMTNILRSVSRSVLQALVIMEQLNGIHSDISPNNVLLSNVSAPEPEAKLSDLENMIVAGSNKDRVQCLECRAPEVWRGAGCWPASDVWSVGVTLVHWLFPETIFGPSDKFIEGMTEAWCIAKIIRMVGPLEAPVNPEYEEEFAVAEFLEKETFTLGDDKPRPFIARGTIRQEIEKHRFNFPSEAFDFIEHLLVIDHTKRPSAKEALNHPFLRSDESGTVDEVKQKEGEA
ncbi:MAG: hypothetical protein M1823_002473 [Watsoniomyces obsoletus]|nr:MAG: hypothetical protein M1823_002473 [Watsoniomyces obsoletus]